MTLQDDLQQAAQLIQSAQSAAEQLTQDKLTLLSENDALRRQLADCQNPPDEPDVALARLLFNVNLREGPGVTFAPVLPQAMEAGSIIPLFEARALGVFHDTEIVTPDAALALSPAEVGSGEVWARCVYQGTSGWAAVIYAGQALMEAVGEAPEPEPEPEPQPEPDWRVPVGPYYNRLDEERLAGDIIRSKVPVALLNIGENEAYGGVVATRALEDDPDRLIIIRNTSHRSIDNLHRDIKLEHFWALTDFSPEDAARQYWRFMGEVINGWDLPQAQRHNLAIMPINEWDGIVAPPPGQREAALTRMNAFYMQLMPLVQADGYRVVLWSLPEGNPEPGEWDHCRSSITNAALFGHIIGGPHAYFEAKEGAHGYTDRAHTLRFLDLWVKCDAWGIDRPRVVLTELALTSALHDGVGYRGMGISAESMLAHVRKVADALQFYDVSACLFAQNVYADFDSFNYGDDRQIVYDVLAAWNTVNQ